MKFLVLVTMALQLIVNSFAQPNPPTFNDFSNVISYVDKITFPNKFNASCLRDSCPGLTKSDLCPYNSDGSFNCETISRTMSILNECLATRKLICNTTMDPIPLPPFFTSLNQFVSNLLNVSCSLAPNTGFMANFSKTLFSVANDKCVSDGCIKYTATNPSLYYYGYGDCDLGFLFNWGFLPTAVMYATNLPFTITNQINCKDNKVRTPNIITDPSTTVDHFFPIVEQIISFGLKSFIQKSRMPKDVASFVNHLASSAIEATEKSCSNKA